MVSKQTLIVFSHLRWNWVWQRPQHLLTRIANTFNIIFIEEPILCKENEEAHWQIDQVAPSIFVWTPYTKCNKLGFNKSQLPELENLLKVLIEKQELNQPLVWLYTPLALPLAKQLHPIVMIYDVMDELTAFKDASPELLEWEAEAYRCVDVVFTGGPSLYRVKRFRHSNVHCFPSSVDTAHFSQAYHSNIDYFTQAELPHPRLGFFGVIDERIDLALLDKIAHKQPTWQIIMVGPVTKISLNDLPRQPNIHYFGQQPYELLPALLSGWDVCLLPFALNDSTRFISPTKTLEYMAAGKPIASTSIADVVELYGDIVYIGDTADDFLSACSLALHQDEVIKNQRLNKMQNILLHTSWNNTALSMIQQISNVAHMQDLDISPYSTSKIINSKCY